MKSAIAALIATAATACENEWIWEECSWMYYRVPCDYEFDNSGEEDGWIYWDDWNQEEFWVTAAEFDEWYWCEGEDYEEATCDNAWEWDECIGESWRDPCEWEYIDYGEDWGWIYWDDWADEEYFLAGDDWMESCA